MRHSLLCILAICFTYMEPLSAQSNIRFVSQSLGTPTGDGLSWATASNDLQAMIDDLPPYGEIKMEVGTYKPQSYPPACVGCASQRDYSFYSEKFLTITGGYLYGGTSPAFNPKYTILSGDIGIEDNHTDNCYHVLISRNYIKLQHLTISKGNANGLGSISVSDKEWSRSNGGGINSLSGVELIFSVLSDNSAFNGGALYGENMHFTCKKCFIKDNNAEYGGALFLQHHAYQLATIEKSVIANNTANHGGAIHVSDLIRSTGDYFDEASYKFKIQLSTLYGNTANSGSVVWSANPMHYKMAFRNSIVHGNNNSIYNYGDPNLYSVHSIMQGAIFSYPIPITTTPDFVNPSNLEGDDGLFFTDDDGLIPQMTSIAAPLNIGAYHWNTTLCPTSTVLYVDINNPTPGDGSTWSAAFVDLNLALRYARRCNNVNEIRVAQGEYGPDQYNWYNRKWDYLPNFYEISITPSEQPFDFPPHTFIIRPGLEMYGGYPSGGGIRDPLQYETILAGLYNSKQVVSIHNPNNNPSDFTVLDGFTIKGGNAILESRQREESYYTNGGGIMIRSKYVVINNNILKENNALKSSAICVYSDTYFNSKYIVLSNNTITSNTASPNIYGEVKGTLISLNGDSCTVSGNIISYNMLGPNSTILDVKGRYHHISENDINNNPSLPINLQSYGSKLSSNNIVNNYGNGVKILGDSCEIFNNLIENNYQHGIFADDEIIIYNGGYNIFGTYDPYLNGYQIQSKNYTKIYDNTIRFNQGGGIFIKGKSDADVYNNKIISNLNNGVIGASNVKNNIITDNIIAISSDSASIHHNIINENQKGIIVTKGNVYNNFVIDNDAAMTIGLGNVYNNVFVNNIYGDTCGGIIIHNNNLANNDSEELHITNNTFVSNRASDVNGAGAIFANKFKGDTIEISNNIFYLNSKGPLTNVAGADFAYSKLGVDFPPISRHNMLQLSAESYTDANNNALGIGSINNLFSAFPSFVSLSNLIGPDNVYMTKDDGLVLAELGLGLDSGIDSEISSKSSIDIVGLPRVLGPYVDIGAYEKINCVTLDTIYVNKNHVHSTGGPGWRSAIQDINMALWLAHECSNVSVINVSADEFTPSFKPFEMQVTGKGIEVNTSDEKDKTFHIRTGVNLYGGFIVHGNTARREPEKFRTTLNGNIGETSVYHTVLMSYNNIYWTDPLDTTLIDGFNIKGGIAEDLLGQKLIVNGNDINKNEGGGINIFGGTNQISHCTFENNQAQIGGAIFLNYDTTIVRNTLIQNNEAEIGGGITSKQSKGRCLNNTFYTNNASRSGGMYIEIGEYLVANNVFYDNQDNFESGALSLAYGLNNIVNNTFFNNMSESAGALYIDKGDQKISNNIFHRNRLNGDFDIAGSDYIRTTGALTVAFHNNAMQLANPTDYNSSNQNNLGTSVDNLFNINPIFYDTLDILGFDNKFGTFDDGLRLLVGSPMVNIGDNAALPTFVNVDIYGSPRIQKGVVDLGAYEGPNVKCPEGIFDTLFVDIAVSVSGNGSTWSQAFKTLDEAIFITHMCPFIKYICVAQGNYHPTTKPYKMQSYLQGIEVETADFRDVTFHLRDGIVLLGGYASGGAIRNPKIYPTILEGQLNEGEDNIYHTCLMASSPHWFIRFDTTIIDGFIINKSEADNPSNTLMINQMPIYANCGGGIFMTNGYHAVKNSSLEYNFASENGGGIYAKNIKSLTLHKNEIIHNTSNDGAGIFVSKSNQLDVGYNSFSDNIASDHGGALYIDSTENVIHHNVVKNNSGLFGSGFYIKNNFKIEDCDFLFNSTLSNGKGGGIFTTKSKGKIDRCVMEGNITDLHGGGLYTDLCDSIFIWNSVFYGNKASNTAGLGGAVYNNKNNHLEQVNCTTYGNVADEGSAIYTSSNDAVLKNNIYFDENPISTVTGNITLTHSIVKGGHPLCSSCPGALGDIDPLFLNILDVDGPDDVYRTNDDGLNVSFPSPATDNGSLYRFLSHDITYRLRDWGNRDIGAYEYFKCPLYDILYVDKQVNGGKGLEWNTAIKEVSTALYIAQSCPSIKEVHVAQSVYFPNYKPFEMTIDQSSHELYTTADMDKTFHFRPGLNVYGGYKNGGTNRDRDLFPSILNGDIADGLGHSRHVVLVGPDSDIWTGSQKVIIDGFHITKGHATSLGGLMVNGKQVKHNIGAGVYVDNSVSTILNDNVINNNLGQGIYMHGGGNILSNNIISSNQGSDGGGIYLSKGKNSLTNNIITDNSASQGGGIYLFKDSTNMSQNIIQQNISTNYWGGGIYGLETKLTLFDNVITSNISKLGGGAYIEHSQFKIDSNLITNNRAEIFGGGGLHIQNSNGLISKNVFSENISTLQSGGALSSHSGKVTIEGNLFTKNKAFFTGGAISSGSGQLHIVNNVFYKDTAQYGAAVSTYFGFNEIQNNTFFKNEGTLNGGAFASIGGNNNLTNNIFFQNTKAGNLTTGADIYNDRFNEPFNVFNSNALQFDESDYTSYNNNELHESHQNVYDADPLFVDESDVLGLDLIFGTNDDGLRLNTSSALINVGNKILIPDTILFDVKKDPRIMNYQIDLGAYECFREPCISNVLYVDTNSVRGRIGNSWSNAFNTLSEALFVAHSCPEVDSILITEGTYYPETKPYQMDLSMKGQEIPTDDYRDLTFHIRQGLTLIGGFPEGGNESSSTYYKTILDGRTDYSISPSYHTVLMDTTEMWTAENKVSSLQSCVVKDGAGAEEIFLDSIWLNGSWIYNNKGGGVYVNGAKANIMLNTISNNEAHYGGAIYIAPSSSVYIEGNNIDANSSFIKGGAIFSEHAEVNLINNSILNNFCFRQELRGLVGLNSLIVLLGNNIFDSVFIEGGTLDAVGINEVK